MLIIRGLISRFIKYILRFLNIIFLPTSKDIWPWIQWLPNNYVNSFQTSFVFSVSSLLYGNSWQFMDIRVKEEMQKEPFSEVRRYVLRGTGLRAPQYRCPCKPYPPQLSNVSLSAVKRFCVSCQKIICQLSKVNVTFSFIRLLFAKKSITFAAVKHEVW